MPLRRTLYDIYLSIKDIELLAEFRLSQILHLYVHKNLLALQTSDLLEKKLALIFLYNFHRYHTLLKLKIKKVIAENQCEKYKNLEGFFIYQFSPNVSANGEVIHVS